MIRKMCMATVSFLYTCTLLLAAFVSVCSAAGVSDGAPGFTYNGFRSAKLSLDGIAGITDNGLLLLTNDTIEQTGHAFYSDPIIFKNSSTGEAFSFSTTFVFAIHPTMPTSTIGGMAFVITPTKSLPGGMSTGFLGMFNATTNGTADNHIVAVELDTFKSIVGPTSPDIDGNHLGIDITTVNSMVQRSAGYYSSKGLFQDLKLTSSEPMQVWIDYDGGKNQMNVTLGPFKPSDKPTIPLLNLTYNFSGVFQDAMYVGFSGALGPVVTNHYVLGWSFRQNGAAHPLSLSHLPKLPRFGPKPRSSLTIWLPLVCSLAIMAVVFTIIFYEWRRRKFAEVLEDWEVAYGPHRFKYKDLYTATRGFKDRELLGKGGFGRVYRGVLPGSKIEIAVKKVSHESRQGMREFVAEIVSIGHLRHRNIVPLLGYCRRKNELLLVYEYMPNGSLDKYLYDQPKSFLDWSQRFKIIKGVASGLFYLHEEWEQLVVHRDVKASNVLLDAELNGRLGDFGLARLYDHGSDPRTTHVVGTLGYLAPEHTRTGKATTSIDVYSFGAFLLEVACGRRPVEPRSDEDIVLVDWVFACWKKGDILETVDPKLGQDYVKEEVELVMKLGLLCSQTEPAARPTMRQAVLYLDGDLALPDFSSLTISAAGLNFTSSGGGFSEFISSYPSTNDSQLQYTSVCESLLSGGR